MFEVNFWRPHARAFRAIPEKAPLLFKMRGMHFVGGFGVFSRYVELSILEAWDAFEAGNGAADRDVFRTLIAKNLRRAISATPWTHRIGCILLWSPVFFDDSDFVARGLDWAPSAQQGGRIDLSKDEGRRVWEECEARARPQLLRRTEERARALEAPELHGGLYLREDRPGQRIFKATLVAAYHGACAIANEHSLPVLDAAHIGPFAEDGPDHVTNGLLLRTDIHKLFDGGFVTVTRDFRFEVSGSLSELFNNGRTYYDIRDRLHGQAIRLPESRLDWPDPASLDWHNRERFRG